MSDMIKAALYLAIGSAIVYMVVIEGVAWVWGKLLQRKDRQ